MRKSVIVLLLLGIFLASPLILAQEQSQTYSGFGRFIDNVKMFFASGDNKVKLALAIREKEIDSAISNSQNKNEKDAIKNLERAHKKLQVVREKISLNVADEVKESTEKIVNKIEDEKNLSDNFEVYVLEEKKTQLTAELTEKTFEWCKELAGEDYTLMLQEEKCNPETAPESLKKELRELKKLQEELFVKLMLDIRSCMDDPGTCNCEDVSDTSEKAKCRKMIALAVQCEYKDNQDACSKMESMRSPVESFVPDFLMSLFKAKQSMIDYNIEKSDVPEECYNENNKPECEQYRHMKESPKCWDAEGNWLEEECPGPKDKEPTMQESIPQCYDENDNFLGEKCGKITMVRNDKGLINYLIEKEIDDVINEFESKAEEGDINESLGQTEVWEVAEGIREVEEDIQGWVVDHPAMDKDGEDGLIWEIKTEMAEDEEGTGDLTPEIKNEMGVENDKGDDGLTTEVETDLNEEDSGGENNVVDESGMVQGTTNEAPGDTIVEGDDMDSPNNVIDEGIGDEGGSDNTGGVDED
ncbi:MAG TPA: hypothetical protein ENG87_03030 [Candidatus Pacearchaeota archaeon]|nr:hypothetical protein BMS3Abin17_00201 [archaeon BMS3Abin17]HDK42326.1 hypothetical protein [Candidatus Pacearchaeota archaeon]HDZ61287.1 hypothetical protein [Candidatus Pacearchaeota archaeon]